MTLIIVTYVAETIEDNAFYKMSCFLSFLTGQKHVRQFVNDSVFLAVDWIKLSHSYPPQQFMPVDNLSSLHMSDAKYFYILAYFYNLSRW